MRIHGHLKQEEIEKTVEASEQFLKRSGAHNADVTVFRLILEELLLIYRESSGENVTYTLRIDPKVEAHKINCILNVRGDSLDVINNGSDMLSRILKKTGREIRWEYQNGSNYISIELPLYNTYRDNIKFAWSYARRYRKNFIFAVACQWVSVVMNIIIPILSARIIVAYTNSALTQIILTALMILIVTLISDLSLFFCNSQYNVVYSRVLSDIEVDLADGAMSIKNACMEEKGAGLFIQRLTVDTSTLATGFNTVADYTSSMFRYIGILVAMLIVSPPVFIVVVVLLVLQTIIESIRTKRMNEDDRIYRTANERFSGLVSEMVHGTSDIKLLNSEQSFHNELKERVGNANNSRMQMILRSWKYKMLRWGLTDIGRLFFICLLGIMIEFEEIAPANALILFNFYTEIGVSVVLLLGDLLEFAKSFNLSAERVCAILNSPDFPKEKFGSVHLDDLKGEIAFDHVSFWYESADPMYQSRLVLDDMSFKIKAGSVAALVGKSGCGKSTIFRLITKLHEAQSGKVLIDGVDVTDLDKDSVRGHLNFVSQKPYLFHMTIRDNLRLIKPDMTDEEMIRVCKLACIDEDIALMPHGYDSLIGEGGVNLSGGQRQRLAIARSLLKDFKILLLDEATSALDNVTQMKIQQALSNIQGEHTIIMIAHRLSTVINADKILFIEDGKVLDEGTHAELISRCGSYRELYNAEQVLSKYET